MVSRKSKRMTKKRNTKKRNNKLRNNKIQSRNKIRSKKLKKKRRILIVNIEKLNQFELVWIGIGGKTLTVLARS